MEAVVETTEEGKTKVHIGITVCEGPGQHRLILTKPYHQAGRVVEIPRSQIHAVRTLGSSNGQATDREAAS